MPTDPATNPVACPLPPDFPSVADAPCSHFSGVAVDFGALATTIDGCVRLPDAVVSLIGDRHGLDAGVVAHV